MTKVNKCYCAFFTFLFIGFSAVLIFTILEITGKSECYHPEILETNELQIGNKTFSKMEFKKFNETHFGICLEGKIPVLKKCCDEDKILRIDEKKKVISCVSNETHFKAALKDHDENSQPLPEYNISNFYQQYSLNSSSNKKYFVDVTGENYTLHREGTLIKGSNPGNNISNSDQFCLDFREGERLTLIAFICYNKEPTHWELKLYSCGMIISIPFLFVIFLSHVMIKELRTLNGVYFTCHTASLLVFYICLAIIQINGKGLHPTFCKICGFIAQFSFHAALFWLNIISFHMWRQTNNYSIKNERYLNVKKDLKKFLFYCFYGWGGPGIVLCASLIMNLHPDILNMFHEPNIGEDMCPINTKSNRLSSLHLYVPMEIIMAFNLYFFISTAVEIYHRQKVPQSFEPQHEKSEKPRLFENYLELFIIMGLTWPLELLRWMIKGPKYIWYIPNFSNCLQGLYIFMIVFPSLQKAVLKKWSQSRYKSNRHEMSVVFSRVKGGGENSRLELNIDTPGQQVCCQAATTP